MLNSEFCRLLLAGACILSAALLLGASQLPNVSDDPVIGYASTHPVDSISALQQKLNSGKLRLTFEPNRGYLASLLRALDISPSSQMLVYSKTSFQHIRINPRTPRAIYFNDTTYIGWVPGGDVIEISTVDPQLGAVFYLLPNVNSVKPRFVRQTYECLQCHEGAMTGGLPGHIMRSVFTRADGQPELRAGTYMTTDRSPVDERWGGWYVTGIHGGQRHMGNSFVTGGEPPFTYDADRNANVTKLDRYLDTSPYLTVTSDIPALMVLAHETSVHNLITRSNYETRIALSNERELNKELNRGEGFRSESTMSRIKSVCNPLIEGLLFCHEAPLAGPFRGESRFAEDFAARGPRDKKGRSLRELEMGTRLFRYPCSFLIYSDAFDGLPVIAKEYIFKRLAAILTGSDQSNTFAHLSPSDKRAIREILTDTKPDFAKLVQGVPKSTLRNVDARPGTAQ